MRKLDCLRCGTSMGFMKREKVQLGQTGFLLGDWPNLLAGSLELDIYSCPKCGKLEFFHPDTVVGNSARGQEAGYELPPEADRRITGVSMDGVPQVRCPACGKTHDFDYPRCPACDCDYYK